MWDTAEKHHLVARGLQTQLGEGVEQEIEGVVGMGGTEGVAKLEMVAVGAEDVYLAIVEITVKTLAGDAGRATVTLPNRKADRQVGASPGMVGKDCLDILFHGEEGDGVQVLEGSVAFHIALMAGEGVVEEQVGIRLCKLILGNEHRGCINQDDGTVEYAGQHLLVLERVAQVGGRGGAFLHVKQQGRGGTVACFGGYEDKGATTDADFKLTFCRGGAGGMLHVAFFSKFQIRTWRC